MNLKISGKSTMPETLLRKIDRNLDIIKNQGGVRVGWFKDTAPYSDGIPVASVALFNEFGRYKRPFLRPCVARNRSKWMMMLARGIFGKGMPIKQVLLQLGLQVKNDLQDEISFVEEPPLAWSTLRARMRKRGLSLAKYRQYAYKGHNGVSGDNWSLNFGKPLEDTGHMIHSISVKVGR